MLEISALRNLDPRKIRAWPGRVLSLVALFCCWSCTPDIDLSRLDTGSSDGDSDGDSDSDGDGDTDGDSDNDVDVDVDGDVDADGDGDADADEEQIEDADIDIEAEEDSDIDIDIDIDIVDEPLITGLDGTGAERAVNLPLEDLTACRALPSERVGAERRLNDTLVVRGENLAGTSAASAVGDCGQGRINFTVEEESMSEVRLRLPAELAITAGGLFLLTLVTPLGEAEAQLFVLQGDQGPAGRDGTNGDRGPAGPPGDSVLDCAAGTCTLDQNLMVEGDLDVAGAGTFDTLEVNELTVLMSVWLPECPQGYERDDSREDIILCTDGRDEMVKVGDFWVDRYESSVWSDAACSATQYGGASDNYPATFPDSGQVRAPANRLYACSRSGVTPSRYLTWFQAQTACAASGKSLITNAEWQMAVAGTNDPGASSVDAGLCLTSGANARPTGRAGRNPGGADSCISLWGAEDMIGNLWEWTSDWWQAGRGWMATDGESADVWPDGYSSDNDDRTWNLNGRAAGASGWASGLPAAALRGGSWGNGTQAGAFALHVSYAPSNSNNDFGFRCVRR